jgi:hypothetical protein
MEIVTTPAAAVTKVLISATNSEHGGGLGWPVHASFEPLN